jgi:hypothetical protein
MYRISALRHVVRASVLSTVFGLVLPVGLGSVVLLSGCEGGAEAPVAKPGLAPETPAPANFDYSKAMGNAQKEAAKK